MYTVYTGDGDDHTSNELYTHTCCTPCTYCTHVHGVHTLYIVHSVECVHTVLNGGDIHLYTVYTMYMV